MKSGKFITLLVVALALCVSAIFLYRKQNAPAESRSDWRGKKVFATLSEKIEDIQRVEFTKQDKKLELVRNEDNEWHAVSNEGYPADNNRVNELIFNLTDLTLSDRITDDKAKYEKFGVEKEIGEEGSLKLSGKKDTLLHLIMGKRRDVPFDPDSPSMESGGYYLRVESDPYVYLTRNSELWMLEPKVSRWANAAILSVPRDDIVDIRINTATSGTAHLAWDDGALKLESIPAGMKQKDSEVQNFRDSLNAVRFEDVFSAKSEKAIGIDFNTSLTLQAKDGTHYQVRGGNKEERGYITLKGSYGEPFFTDDDKASTTTLAAAEQKAKEAKAAVPGFNKKHEPWIYEMESYLFSRLVRDPNGLIEPIAPANDEDSSGEVSSMPAPAVKPD